MCLHRPAEEIIQYPRAVFRGFGNNFVMIFLKHVVVVNCYGYFHLGQSGRVLNPKIIQYAMICDINASSGFRNTNTITGFVIS